VSDVPQSTYKEPSNPPRRRRPWGVIAALVILAVLVVLALARKPKTVAVADNDQLSIPNIHTATAHLGDIGYYVEALGTVTPLATVNVYSQVNGVVTAVHYVEGQMVHKGDPLIDIDPRPYEAQVLQSEGTLEKDRAVLKQAQMDLARYKDANDQQAIARQTYEDQAQLVEQEEGTVKNDLGSLQYAQTQLSYCHLVSPITGRIGLRLIDPGNTVFSGSQNALVVITQLQPITVVFNVPEDSLGDVRQQIVHHTPLPVDVLDRSQQTKLASGKLITLDNQIDTSTGTVRFRGEFANPDFSLFPNQFVNARLLTKTLKNAVLIPTAAVQRNGTQAFVYLVQNDVAKIHNITELTTEGDNAAITGLNPGDVVSVTGFDKLQDGSKVNIQNQNTQSQAGAPGSGL
jgi:multidrug efflux system membrane fusion protein